jgi:hypothetical protein
MGEIAKVSRQAKRSVVIDSLFCDKKLLKKAVLIFLIIFKKYANAFGATTDIIID